MRRIRLVEMVGNAEGGGTKCVARIVSHLNPERYDITVIAPSASWLADLSRQHGATYRPLPLLSSRTNPALYAELAKMVAQAEPDIISAHGTRAAWYALRALPKLSDAPPLLYSEHLFSFDARRGAFKWPWIALEGYICRRAQIVATACEANARIIERRGWKRSDAIAMRHYGIELETFMEQAARRVSRLDLGIADNAPLIGTVGRLIPQKGFRYWLAAAARVAAEMPQAHFIVIGDGELRRQLEEQCVRMGIAGQVRFLGEEKQPWRILATCDVVAFSSLFEGLPQTGIEALAAGVATVATRLKGTSELIQSGWNGMLVAPRDARALAAAILHLLHDPDLRRRLAARGPESVAEYRTETMVARFDAAFERLYAQRERVAAMESAPVRLGRN